MNPPPLPTSREQAEAFSDAHLMCEIRVLGAHFEPMLRLLREAGYECCWAASEAWMSAGPPEDAWVTMFVWVPRPSQITFSPKCSHCEDSSGWEYHWTYGWVACAECNDDGMKPKPR